MSSTELLASIHSLYPVLLPPKLENISLSTKNILLFTKQALMEVSFSGSSVFGLAGGVGAGGERKEGLSTIPCKFEVDVLSPAIRFENLSSLSENSGM